LLLQVALLLLNAGDQCVLDGIDLIRNNPADLGGIHYNYLPAFLCPEMNAETTRPEMYNILSRDVQHTEFNITDRTVDYVDKADQTTSGWTRHKFMLFHDNICEKYGFPKRFTAS